MNQELIGQLYNQAQTYHKARYSVEFDYFQIEADGSIDLVTTDRWGDRDSVSVKIDEIWNADIEAITALRLLQEKKEREKRAQEEELRRIERQKQEKERRFQEYQKLKKEFE